MDTMIEYPSIAHSPIYSPTMFDIPSPPSNSTDPSITDGSDDVIMYEREDSPNGILSKPSSAQGLNFPPLTLDPRYLLRSNHPEGIYHRMQVQCFDRTSFIGQPHVLDNIELKPIGGGNGVFMKNGRVFRATVFGEMAGVGDGTRLSASGDWYRSDLSAPVRPPNST